MSFGGQGKDNSIRATTSTGECPVQIGIVLTVGYKVLAGAGDNLPFERLICSETVFGSEGRVTSSLGISASNANSWALSTDDLKALSISGGIGFKALDTSAQLDRFASVVRVRVVGNGDILEVVKPNAEGSGASALTIVIVARVTNN